MLRIITDRNFNEISREATPCEEDWGPFLTALAEKFMEDEGRVLVKQHIPTSDKGNVLV